jgi:hypothetical protein
MVTLHRGSFFLIQHFQASAYVRINRTALQFKAAIQAIHAIADCRKALEGFDLAGYGVLFDWRLPPMSTDPVVHQTIVQHVDAFAAPFARRAILVRTPVGQMQVARVSRMHSEDAPVLFNDEGAAILHVARRVAQVGA